MKKIVTGKYMATVIVSALLTTGCSYFSKDSNAEKAASNVTSAAAAKISPEAAKSIDAAKAVIKQAKANDWIWRDTEKFLKQAEAAAAKGDDATAIKLANKAKSQAELAVKQYELEQSTARDG